MDQEQYYNYRDDMNKFIKMKLNIISEKKSMNDEKIREFINLWLKLLHNGDEFVKRNPNFKSACIKKIKEIKIDLNKLEIKLENPFLKDELIKILDLFYEKHN
jgi:hypothetical protein